MLKCPFCGFDNEDGALFCEQCKSDLSDVAASAPPAAPVAEAVAEAIAEAHIMEAAPVADVVEAAPVAAVVDEAAPVAAVVEEEAAVAAVVEEPPLAEALPAEPPPAAEAAPVPPPPPPAAPEPAVGAAPPAPPEAPPAPPPVSAPAAPAAPAAALPAGATPKLKVIRGQKVGIEFPLYEGNNFIGRADEQPVDIDLEDQEPPEKIWCSRQHALVTFDSGALKLEDLNSSNGTYLNRARVHPGQPQSLKPNDVIQIGTVQLKVIV